MKILLLYTPRSGSTSIMRYFQKVNPEYEIFNQPWSMWSDSPIVSLDDIKIYENVFVKNAVDWIFAPRSKYKFIPSLDEIFDTFDKIVLLSRKNLLEQTQSLYFSLHDNSYTNQVSKLYHVDNIDKIKYEQDKLALLFNIDCMENLKKNYNLTHFYYEDLYEKSFDSLFKFLNLEFNILCFNEFLSLNKRYKKGEVYTKQIQTLI
jgi:hypothetical protein